MKGIHWHCTHSKTGVANRCTDRRRDDVCDVAIVCLVAAQVLLSQGLSDVGPTAGHNYWLPGGTLGKYGESMIQQWMKLGYPNTLFLYIPNLGTSHMNCPKLGSTTEIVPSICSGCEQRALLGGWCLKKPQWTIPIQILPMVHPCLTTLSGLAYRNRILLTETIHSVYIYIFIHIYIYIYIHLYIYTYIYIDRDSSNYTILSKIRCNLIEI